VTVDDLFATIADGAVSESRLWAESLRPADAREHEPVFSPLVPDPGLALGLETIYEGYLLHHGRSRLFDPIDDDIALLLGDTLLAQGLVRIADTGNIVAVADLAALLSLCSQARAEGRDGDGAAWAATAAYLGKGGLDDARRTLRDDRDPGPLLAAAAAVHGAPTVDSVIAAHRVRVR
jgi:hypothetical protein